MEAYFLASSLHSDARKYTVKILPCRYFLVAFLTGDNASAQPLGSEAYFNKLHQCKAVGVLAC